jgi:divalent metal cation (Fe/Co/Zn/Cd) transporter
VLAYVAYALGRDTKELLIGEAVDPELRLAVIGELHRYDGVEGVLEMLTMLLGPDQALVAAKLDVRDDLRAGDLELLTARIERELRDAHPEIVHLYLSATRGDAGQRDVAAGLRRLATAAEGGPAEREQALQSLSTGAWRR